MFLVKGKHENLSIYSKLLRRRVNGSEEKGNYSKRKEKVALCKRNRILESEKFLLVEFGI